MEKLRIVIAGAIALICLSVAAVGVYRMACNLPNGDGLIFSGVVGLALTWTCAKN